MTASHTPDQPRVLSRRELNRALMSRQLLDARVNRSALDVIDHLVGLQSQDPFPPYVGLWTRIEGFAPDDLAALLHNRAAARASLMRGTIHLVTADDVLFIRPLVQPLYDALVRRVLAHDLAGVDYAALLTVHRELLATEPISLADLGANISPAWPDHPPRTLAMLAPWLHATIQAPPRAIWGANGPVRHVLAERWFGRPLHPDPDLAVLVRRYLRAFGPASAADFRQWSGISRVAPVFANLRKEARVFRDEQGTELFDLPDGQLPAAETPLPARFLPAFDNVLLSHADRSRVLDPAHKPLVFTVNGIVKPTILLDGFVAGLWKQETDHLRVTPFRPLSPEERAELESEGSKLHAFLTDGRQEAIRFDS